MGLSDLAAHSLTRFPPPSVASPLGREWLSLQPAALHAQAPVAPLPVHEAASPVCSCLHRLTLAFDFVQCIPDVSS